MNGPFALVLFWWMAINAINAGVILFVLVILFAGSTRWYFKLAIAAVMVVLAWFGQYYGFNANGTQVAYGPLDFKSVMLLTALIHTIALVALVWIIVWLFKRNVTGFHAVLKWIAIPLSLAGACVTLMLLLFLVNVSVQHNRLDDMLNADGIIVPESPDYQGGDQ